MVSMSKWQNNNNERYTLDDDERKHLAILSLIPLIATLMVIAGTICISNEKHNILEFIGNIGTKKAEKIKRKIEEHKEKKEIKKAEQDKIKNRSEILDL